jgi:hypothetical protein
LPTNQYIRRKKRKQKSKKKRGKKNAKRKDKREYAKENAKRVLTQKGHPTKEAKKSKKTRHFVRSPTRQIKSQLQPTQIQTHKTQELGQGCRCAALNLEY